MVKPQGRRGEVAADLFTDFPERFAERRKLFALAAGGERRELEVEEFWPHKGRMVFKFRGIDSISEAETLVGMELQIPRAERTPLAAGSQYVDELVGCRVAATTRGRQAVQSLGIVADVQFGAGEAPLLVIRREQDQKEFLVPFAEEFLLQVDIASKSIEMTLPEGLLELDAPLSLEEKQRQARSGKERE